MSKVAVFSSSYRFRMGDKVTAILDANGKLNLKDDAGGLEQFASYKDYVKDVQKEKPETGSEEDILDQLSNTLGDFEAVETTVSDTPKKKPMDPSAKVEDKNKKVDTTMATKTAKEKPLKKPAEKATKEAAPCHCGCKRDTFGKAGFAPGHDARVHGWGKKIADGRMTFEEIDAKLNPEIKDKGTAAVAWLKAHGVKQGKPAKVAAAK